MVSRDDELNEEAETESVSVESTGTAVSETKTEPIYPVIDLVVNCACFIYIGAWLDFGAFDSPHLGIIPWKLVVLFFWILVFRRIPALFVLYKWIPEIDTWQDALFTGHFGKRCCL